MDGCRFTVRSPAISTERRALFARGEYEIAERCSIICDIEGAEVAGLAHELDGSPGAWRC